jgi:short-subunit dehydrogenase
MSASKTALITGASGGIGAVYAERLARRGHDLILIARDEARLRSLAERIGKTTGRQVEVVRADLTRKEDLLGVEQRLRSDRSIDLLVNNAGIAAAGTLLDSEADGLQTMVELNVLAPLRLARAAAENFVARKSGTIINIASVLALAPERFNGTYSGTKAFLLNLSLSLDQRS